MPIETRRPLIIAGGLVVSSLIVGFGTYFALSGSSEVGTGLQNRPVDAGNSPTGDKTDPASLSEEGGNAEEAYFLLPRAHTATPGVLEGSEAEFNDAIDSTVVPQITSYMTALLNNRTEDWGKIDTSTFTNDPEAPYIRAMQEEAFAMKTLFPDAASFAVMPSSNDGDSEVSTFLTTTPEKYAGMSNLAFGVVPLDNIKQPLDVSEVASDEYPIVASSGGSINGLYVPVETGDEYIFVQQADGSIFMN